MLQVAIPFIALAAANGGFAGPTVAEFAKALAEFTGNPVAVSDVRRLSCKGFEEEPTEAQCYWQQKSGNKWKRFSTYVAVDERGWHLIDSANSIS
jgi:hypothetical protein